ncbi:MAG: helix-turn-helix transcriptional regulator [Clostridiales bacterium]|nr:helix-turn-helix transcriptional regulator [Clostridiales bacterium]
MPIDNKSIGRNIKHYRNVKGLSQEELANLVFVSSTHISYLETGTKFPSLELLLLIANALDVSADDLLAENLIHTSSNVGKELHTVLQNCSPKEKELIIRVVMFLKDLFSEFEI